MACSLPHTDSKIEALVQRLINEDKGRQDALLELAFRFEDSCAKVLKRIASCIFLCYGKAAQLEKQMGAKLAWLQEKYSHRTREGIDCLSSQANCSLTEKELHQLRMDEEALKEALEEEAMNKRHKRRKLGKNKPKIMSSF
ncbi:hypothetical protein Tco_0670983 [Tanacetum coccineum]